MDRFSESSVDSKPHRQRERSTSEYMEEAPHLSDFPTSPETSPQMGVRRYPPTSVGGYQMTPYEPEGAGLFLEGHHHFESGEFVDERTVGRDAVYQREIHTTQVHSGFRQEFSTTHDGKERSRKKH